MRVNEPTLSWFQSHSLRLDSRFCHPRVRPNSLFLNLSGEGSKGNENIDGFLSVPNVGSIFDCKLTAVCKVELIGARMTARSKRCIRQRVWPRSTQAAAALGWHRDRAEP